MLMTPNAYLRPYFATDYWTIFFICLLVCLKGTSELLILQLPPTPPLTSPPLPQHTHAKHVYFSYFQVLTLDKCQSHTHSCLNQRPGTIPDSFFFIISNSPHMQSTRRPYGLYLHTSRFGPVVSPQPPL